MPGSRVSSGGLTRRRPAAAARIDGRRSPGSPGSSSSAGVRWSALVRRGAGPASGIVGYPRTEAPPHWYFDPVPAILESSLPAGRRGARIHRCRARPPGVGSSAPYPEAVARPNNGLALGIRRGGSGSRPKTGACRAFPDGPSGGCELAMRMAADDQRTDRSAWNGRHGRHYHPAAREILKAATRDHRPAGCASCCGIRPELYPPEVLGGATVYPGRTTLSRIRWCQLGPPRLSGARPAVRCCRGAVQHLRAEKQFHGEPVVQLGDRRRPRASTRCATTGVRIDPVPEARGSMCFDPIDPLDDLGCRRRRRTPVVGGCLGRRRRPTRSPR